ncbi:hypothetical protein [Nonomuraea sp. KM88]|uniref:hypothetical protein n=1 Tax=Nonomuraea sp. KM88 TaxID=3457427 RepID=UPI003FCE65B9
MDDRTAIELICRKAGYDAWARLSDSIAEEEVLVVSGSLFEGIGNVRSDLDFFVVSDNRPRDVPVRMAFAGASWLDIEYVRARELEDLTRKLATTDPKAIAQVLRLSRPELDRYYRLAIGATVKGAYPTSVVFSLEAYRPVLRSWAILHAGAFSARATIALNSGDVTAATLYACYAAHLCTMGTLTDVGELYPSPKYTLEKAIRAFGPDSAEVATIAALLHPSVDPVRHVRAAVEHIDTVLAESLSGMNADDLVTEAAAPIEHDRRHYVSTLMTRKAAYDVLPEDTAAITALLPALGPHEADGSRKQAPSVWQAQAHRLVLREALIDAGLLREVKGHAR